jgi:hypothetical protein
MDSAVAKIANQASASRRGIVKKAYRGDAKPLGSEVAIARRFRR